MAGLQVFIVWASILTAVSGSHMQGGTVSFRTTKNPQGGWMVDFKYKSAFESAYASPFYWSCFYGDCGYEINHWIEPVENRTKYPSRWYQYEGHVTRRVYNDKPFQLWEDSCCWVNNYYYYSGWTLTAAVDLGIRSDTHLPNSSPVTTIIPVIRIPQNCGTTINLLGYDPDGDHVSCRYGYYYPECSSCWWIFSLDNRQCALRYPGWYSIGSYVMELILEDSPRDYMYLSYNDGTRAYKYPSYNRKSRELPKDSQKYFWYDTTVSSETFYDSTTWATESITSEESFVETERFTDTSTTYYATDETTGVTSRPLDMETVTLEGSGGPDVTTRDLRTTEDLVGDFMSTSYPTIEAETEAVTFPYRTTEWDYLTSDGQHSWDSLSKISLQFIVEVTNQAPSCTFGDYRPKFVSPTPRHGEKLLTNVGSVFQLHLSAQATYETISDFKVSGPPGIAKSLPRSRSTTRSTVAEWRPSESNVGEHVPFCFVAETSNGYQSEMRCIIVVVGPKNLDNIDLMCHENTMTLIAAKSADHELYENQFRLNDPKCLVSSNSTHLIASVAYNTCGTEIEETEHEIVFKNQASSFHNESSVITRKHGVSIPFNCSFPKKSRVSASFRARKSDYVFAEAGFGNFTYTFQFYTDDRFVEVETQYPLQVELRELIYMEIQVSSSIPNVQLFVESCKATPHDNPDDPIFYDIKRNGCIIDETFVEYSSTRTRYRFAMEAFAFIGDYSERSLKSIYHQDEGLRPPLIPMEPGAPPAHLHTALHPGGRCPLKENTIKIHHDKPGTLLLDPGTVTVVYMSCTVILCKSGDPSTRCNQGCLPKSMADPKRRRRSLTSESQQHFISQGPLRMKRQSPSDTGDVESPSLNVNTLVMSLSGVAMVVLLGLSVHLYTKRRRLSGYQRLHTQDL